MIKPSASRAGRVATVVFVLASALASGCVGHLHTPYRPQPEPAKPLSEAGFDTSLFAYAPGSAPRQTRLASVRRHYHKVRLEFPPLARNGSPAVQLSATYHRSTLPTARKLVIVLPIWGSYRYPPRKTVNTLIKRSKGDMHVLEIHGEDPIFYWQQLRDAPTEAAFTQLAGDMTGRVTDTVISIRQLLDWIEQQAEVDPQQIGLVGFSLGSIVAAIALGVDERIAGAVLMMGAGKPGLVFATCNGYPGEVRKAAMQRFGWSVDRYQQLFDELFKMGDPEIFAHKYKPESLLIIDGA